MACKRQSVTQAPAAVPACPICPGKTPCNASQEGLFLHAPAYEHQALEALVLHAWYTAKHLAPAARLGCAAARDVAARHPGPPHRARNLRLYEALPGACA